MISRNAICLQRRLRQSRSAKWKSSFRRVVSAELVEHALANAREALGRKLAETSSQQKLLGALTETFSLPRAPRRIEVYDNSHISGTNGRRHDRGRAGGLS